MTDTHETLAKVKSKCIQTAEDLKNLLRETGVTGEDYQRIMEGFEKQRVKQEMKDNNP